MSQQNIYQVQLLNDLHNYFPDVLYNSGRFRNVQDLLEYIRQVADTSPYSRGLTSYNNRQTLNARVNSVNAINAGRAPPTYRSVGLAPTAPTAPTTSPHSIPTTNTPRTQPVMAAVFEEHIPTTTRIRVPLNTTNNTNTTMLMNTILGGMFSDLFAGGGGGGSDGLQGFLNQRVPVYPSVQEIDRATTLFRAGSNRQGDICTICQDDIDINQEIRILDHCSHSFHRDCIDTWFQGNVHCPTCRHDVREVTNTTTSNRTMRDNNENTNRQENQVPSNTNSNAPPPVPDNYRRMNIQRTDP